MLRGIFAAMGLLALSCTCHAATITVNTNNGGGVDINGNCSLSEATAAASFNVAIDNCTAGGSGVQDTITFDSSIFSGPPFFTATISLEQSLDIADAGVVIEPLSGGNLIISGDGSDNLFTYSAGDLVIRNLTLNAGNASGDGGAIEVLADQDANLLLDNVSAINHQANGKGGVVGGETSAFFNLNIIDSNFSNNTAMGNGEFIGGGVIGLEVLGPNANLNIFIDSSRFSANDADDNGGAVALGFASGSTQGRSFGLTISNSIFNDNDAQSRGGTIYLTDSNSSGNRYFAQITDSTFFSNTALNAGAIWAEHGNSGLDTLAMKRNSFIGNSSTSTAGAVWIRYLNLELVNNLFAGNTTSTSPSSLGNPGALRLEFDDAFSDNSAYVLANTFFENDGNPKTMRLDMPLIGMGAGPSRFQGNLVKGLTGGTSNCDINNFPSSSFNATNLPNDDCAPGTNLTNINLMLSLEDVDHPVHDMAVIPDPGSPIIDFWPEVNCNDSVGSPLTMDMLGPRRDGATGMPPDGDGDGEADCDAGSVEAAPVFALTVATAGDGTGNVESSPNGINCPGSCTTNFAEDTPVSLTATANADSQFTGWGGDCSGTGACQVTMDQARNVTATFDLTGFSLNAAIEGNAPGSITSTPAGINCPGDCSQVFPIGQMVSLFSSPGAGATFQNWTGDCSGIGSCQVTMDQARQVGGVFIDGNTLFVDSFE